MSIEGVWKALKRVYERAGCSAVLNVFRHVSAVWRAVWEPSVCRASVRIAPGLLIQKDRP